METETLCLMIDCLNLISKENVNQECGYCESCKQKLAINYIESII